MLEWHCLKLAECSAFLEDGSIGKSVFPGSVIYFYSSISSDINASSYDLASKTLTDQIKHYGRYTLNILVDIKEVI